MVQSEIDFYGEVDGATASPNASSLLRPNASMSPQVMITVPVGGRAMQTFCAVSVPIIVALGLLGNTLSFVILKESARRVSSHFYLCCLAVMDSVTLLSIMLSIWLGVIMQGYYYVHGQFVPGNWVQVLTGICSLTQFRVYLSFFCRMVSVWTIVILTVERCVMVMSPLKWGTRLCTVRNGAIAIGVLVVVSAVVNIYVIVGFGEQTIRGQVKCKPNKHFFIGRVAGKTILSVVPWAIICIANLLLVVTLRRRNQQSGGTYQRQENSVTSRLLVVSIAFLLFTLPLTIMSTIHSGHEMSHSKEHKSGALADLWMISFVIFTMNFAFNFVLYCLTGSNFRRAALALLLCQMGRMTNLRQRIDRSGSQSAGSSKPLGRSDSGNSRTNVTVLSRDTSSVRQASNASENVNLLPVGMRKVRKETQI